MTETVASSTRVDKLFRVSRPLILDEVEGNFNVLRDTVADVFGMADCNVEFVPDRKLGAKLMQPLPHGVVSGALRRGTIHGVGMEVRQRYESLGSTALHELVGLCATDSYMRRVQHPEGHRYIAMGWIFDNPKLLAEQEELAGMLSSVDQSLAGLDHPPYMPIVNAPYGSPSEAIDTALDLLCYNGQRMPVSFGPIIGEYSYPE